MEQAAETLAIIMVLAIELVMTKVEPVAMGQVTIMELATAVEALVKVTVVELALLLRFCRDSFHLLILSHHQLKVCTQNPSLPFEVQVILIWSHSSFLYPPFP